jgi:tetratricopeptide (TPR) repeat protein
LFSLSAGVFPSLSLGCYYWTINKLDLAQRYIKRSLKKNRSFVDGWILLGHIYASNDESEQALSSYRTAIRLLPSHKLPYLCLSKELIRGGNYWLAGHMLQSAKQLDNVTTTAGNVNGSDSHDLLILNEMALISVKLNSYNEAESILRKAIEILSQQQQQQQQVGEKLSSSTICEVRTSEFFIYLFICLFVPYFFIPRSFIIMQLCYENKEIMMKRCSGTSVV